MKGNLRRYSTFVAKLQPNSKPCEVFAYNEKTKGATPKSLIKHYLDHKPEKYTVDILVNILEKLKALRMCLLASENRDLPRLNLCDRFYLGSAVNLSHHLALKCLDLHQLNEDLSSVGLQRLDSTNTHVIPFIDTIIQLLKHLVSDDYNMEGEICTTSEECRNMRKHTISIMKERAFFHTAALFGPCEANRQARIMVTAGKEAIANEMLITDLIKAGANIIRINCAHDDPSVWIEIIRIAKQSSALLGKTCRVLMDLAGPKLRTASLLVNKNATMILPEVDDNGHIILPAHFWLCCDGSSPPSGLSCHVILRTDHKFFSELMVGDTLCLIDPTGGSRAVKLLNRFSLLDSSGYLAECSEDAYISLDGKFCVRKEDNKLFGQVLDIFKVEKFVTLKIGDVLTLTRSSFLAKDELSHENYCTAMITCSSDHIFNSVKPGEPIAFDDGRIRGKIQEKSINEIVVIITHASTAGSKLGTKKSINLPKSDTRFLKGLTSKDLMDLDFVIANADIVGISFIRDVNDMASIQRELDRRMVPKLGLILKIETSDAFENLPELLFQAMQSSNPIGVMIARGDLMVECGWDQLAWIQKEIMSVCSAAHIPVTWATEVLDTLIKSGVPSRAEITDVANAMKASCIMLNKGKHVVDAVSALDSMLCKHSDRRRKEMLLNLPFKFSRI